MSNTIFLRPAIQLRYQTYFDSHKVYVSIYKITEGYNGTHYDLIYSEILL